MQAGGAVRGVRKTRDEGPSAVLPSLSRGCPKAHEGMRNQSESTYPIVQGTQCHLSLTFDRRQEKGERILMALSRVVCWQVFLSLVLCF